MMRCNEPGWRLASLPDGRRGIWYREVVEPTASGAKEHFAIELCSGREGDDSYARLSVGQVLDAKALLDIANIFSDGAWACEIRAGDALHEDGPITAQDAGIVRHTEAAEIDAVVDVLRDCAKRLRGAAR